MTSTFQTTNPFEDMYQMDELRFVIMKPEIHQYLNWKPSGLVQSRVIFGSNDSIYEYKTAVSVVSVILRKNPQESGLAKIITYIVNMMKMSNSNPKVLNKMKISIFLYSTNPIPYFNYTAMACSHDILGEQLIDGSYYEYEITLLFGNSLEVFVKDVVSFQTFLLTDRSFQLKQNAFQPTVTPPSQTVVAPTQVQVPPVQPQQSIFSVPVVTQQQSVFGKTGFGGSFGQSAFGQSGNPNAFSGSFGQSAFGQSGNPNAFSGAFGQSAFNQPSTNGNGSFGTMKATQDKLKQ